jgi:enamine deaminase RidA (YjgF/YER057c/UK114 family)
VLNNSNKRQSIAIDGLSHQTAIPVASKIGPLLTSSVIAPFNPGTRDVPDAISAQYANLFRHAELILAAAGGDWRHVAKMDFWLARAEDRPPLEVFWLERFPDEASRPARHTHVGQVQRMSASLLAFITD